MSRDEDVELWKRVIEPDCAELVEAAGRIDPFDAAALTRLRRRGHDPGLVHVAVELARARRKASKKFPDRPDIVATIDGIEQATSQGVASHKARRFAVAGFRSVADLCCGIGGDAMSLVEQASVLGVDRDPVMTWMCHRNAGCKTVTSDVDQLPRREIDAFHIDPARRLRSASGLRRRRRLADYEPGPGFLAALLSEVAHGCVKLGPGVDPADLAFAQPCELEFISEDGVLVQAALWSGALARHGIARSATKLPEHCSVFGGVALPPSGNGKAGTYLFEPDPAIERAQLLHVICSDHDLRELHPGIGLLTGNESIESPWLCRFIVIAQMPWRPGLIRRWLNANDGGIVECKTRGRAVDADVWQKRLRGNGLETFTVFGLRLGTRKVAIMARRER